MPPGASARQQIDNTLVKALALGFRWKRLLELGDCATIAELAKREKIAPSYATRVLRLTQLEPNLIEAVLDGQQGGAVTLARLMEPFPLSWNDEKNIFSGE